MKNPYEILKVKQNASKAEVQEAFLRTVKENLLSKKYSNKELMEAQQQLLIPEKRLVADFLFPIQRKSRRPRLIDVSQLEMFGINEKPIINEDAFDSLDCPISIE